MSYTDYVKRTLANYRGGTKHYRSILATRTQSATQALHLGCGRDLGNMLGIFPDSCRVIGLDPDERALVDYPGSGFVGTAEDMPFANDEFDLIICEMVLEHLTNPYDVMSEVFRVLKPGGFFLAVTPNFWSYKSLAAAATPHKFHELAVQLLRKDSPRESRDVYPTFYRANTGLSIRRLARKTGLTIERLDYIDNGPTWFQRLPALFELGRAYHLLLKLPFLEFLRCNLVIELRKPDRTR